MKNDKNHRFTRIPSQTTDFIKMVPRLRKTKKKCTNKKRIFILSLLSSQSRDKEIEKKKNTKEVLLVVEKTCW